MSNHTNPSPQHHALCVSLRGIDGANALAKTQVILPSNISVKHGIYLKAYTINGLKLAATASGGFTNVYNANAETLWHIKITPSDTNGIGNHMMRNTNATPAALTGVANENYSNAYPIPLFDSYYGHRDYSPPSLIAQFTSNNFNRFTVEILNETMGPVVTNANTVESGYNQKVDLWLIID